MPYLLKLLIIQFSPSGSLPGFNGWTRGQTGALLVFCICVCGESESGLICKCEPKGVLKFDSLILPRLYISYELETTFGYRRRPPLYESIKVAVFYTTKLANKHTARLMVSVWTTETLEDFTTGIAKTLQTIYIFERLFKGPHSVVSGVNQRREIPQNEFSGRKFLCNLTVRRHVRSKLWGSGVNIDS